jgi:hypothetical protein
MRWFAFALRMGGIALAISGGLLFKSTDYQRATYFVVIAIFWWVMAQAVERER